MTGLAMDAASIAATVERVSAGDEVAFARIVGAYHADMVRVAFVICGDEGLAQDAALGSPRPGAGRCHRPASRSGPSCTWTASDARLTGLDLTLGSADLHADGSGKGWGSLALRAGDGLWLGSWSMDLGADGTTTVRTSLVGLLALEGLVYQDVQVGRGDTWTVTGWISAAE